MKQLQKFRAGFGRVVIGVGYIALVLLLAMVIIVTVDVVMRKLSGSSLRINGSNELTSLFMVVVCTLFIPVLQLKRGHIWVELFVNKFPYRFRCFWLGSIMTLETVVIATLCIGSYRRLADLLSTGRASDVLHLPWWIFAVFVLIAFVEYFIISLIDTIQYFIDGAKNEPPELIECVWSEEEAKGS